MSPDGKDLDALSVLSILLGYENLIENRQQSRQNDVQTANDKQAAFMLSELNHRFDEQNVMLKQILEVLTHEDHQNDGRADQG